ncbi:MAG: hypothetical protein NDI58_07300 [Geothrix sp.]|nr:hypothetical protein [Geothrix sp.]
MRISTSKTLLSAALLLTAGFTLAAQDKPAAKTAPAPAAKAPAKPKGKLKPVDINSATKNEIAFMLAIPEDLAAKIVAGRPYPTKARLLTNKIVTPEVYAAIKDKVVARQTAPVR